MADEILRLNLVQKEIGIVLEDENGDEIKYILKELTGAERNTYLNRMKNKVKIDKNGKATITSFDGMQADLLKVSLFNENGEAATVEMIESMPSSAQMKLFETAQALSGLDKEVDDEKNG